MNKPANQLTAADLLKRLDRAAERRRRGAALRVWADLAYAGLVCVAVSAAAVYFVSKLDAAFN